MIGSKIWRERRRGKIGHMFERFGKVKPAYRVCADGTTRQGQAQGRTQAKARRRWPSLQEVIARVMGALPW